METLRSQFALYLAFCLAFASRTVYGADRCQAFFADREVGESTVTGFGLALASWNGLPNPLTFELRRDFVRSLRSHPRIQLLQTQFGTGSNLAFAMNQLRWDVIAGTAEAFDGEIVQSVFLYRVLKSIFTEAQFSEMQNGVHRSLPRHLRVIEIAVADLAEFGSRDHSRTVPMEILKVVNPGPPRVAQALLRRSMRLPQDARIASIYASRYSDRSDIMAALGTILRDNLAQVVVFSKANRFSDVEEIGRIVQENYGIRVLNPEDLAAQPIRAGEQVMILNNTRGRIPYIHGAADFAVTIGSANIVEAPNMGTPSFHFRWAMHRYDQNNWDSQREYSERSGLGHAIQNSNDLIQMVPRVLGTRSTHSTSVPVYLIPNATSVRPIDRLVERIERLLDTR